MRIRCDSDPLDAIRADHVAEKGVDLHHLADGKYFDVAGGRLFRGAQQRGSLDLALLVMFGAL